MREMAVTPERKRMGELRSNRARHEGSGQPGRGPGYAATLQPPPPACPRLGKKKETSVPLPSD